MILSIPDTPSSNSQLKTITNLNQKVLIPLFLMMLISCSDSKPENTSNNDSTGRQKSDMNKQALGDRPPVNCEGFVEITADFKTANDLISGLESFHKFQIIPYRRNLRDSMRLYITAKDERDNDIGRSFYASKDGRQLYPYSRDGASILYPGLALFKGDIDSKWPRQGKTIRFIPIEEVEAEGQFYKSYHLFVDDEDTGLDLKPSPPAKLMAAFSQLFPNSK